MSETIKKQIVIIGSGPAGYTAGIYAVRAGLDTAIISGYQQGGQLTTTSMIENYPGFPEPIDATTLMFNMQQQAENLGAKIYNKEIVDIDFSKKPFTLKADSGDVFEAESIIIATGSSPRKTNVKGEEFFWGYGVSVCATCDGFFYRNKDVAIIGGGNSAIIEAILLSSYAKSVTVINKNAKLSGEQIMLDKLEANPKITTLHNTILEEIIGTEQPKSVTGIKIKNKESNKSETLNVDGVFVAIGRNPTTEIFKYKIELDDRGYIKTPCSTKTNIEGVFAAGDVTNPRFKQAVIAAALGCEAALEAENYLLSKKE